MRTGEKHTLQRPKIEGPRAPAVKLTARHSSGHCDGHWHERERERERERESFRNNLHNGVVSSAARGQALLGPLWAALTPDSRGDPTGDTEEPDRRRQETPHLSSRRKEALPASPEREREFY